MLRGRGRKTVAPRRVARTRHVSHAGGVRAPIIVIATRTVLLSAALLFLSGCLVSDYACSEHQVVAPGQLLSCQCEPGYVLGPEGYGCVACAADEVVAAGKCECKMGYSRNAATGVCEPTEGS